MKDNTKFGGDFLKGQKYKCECGFSIPIPRGIPDKLRKLECPKCGIIYRVCAKKAWQFLPVRVRIRQRLAASLTPIPHARG